MSNSLLILKQKWIIIPPFYWPTWDQIRLFVTKELTWGWHAYQKNKCTTQRDWGSKGYEPKQEPERLTASPPSLVAEREARSNWKRLLWMVSVLSWNVMARMCCSPAWIQHLSKALQLMLYLQSQHINSPSLYEIFFLIFAPSNLIAPKALSKMCFMRATRWGG